MPTTQEQREHEDHVAAIRMQVAELLASYEVVGDEAHAEFDRRFGPDANENLASWCVGHRATAEDMLVLCATDWPRYRSIMRGAEIGDDEPVHGLDHWRTLRGFGGRCDCGDWSADAETIDALLAAYRFHLATA